MAASDPQRPSIAEPDVVGATSQAGIRHRHCLEAPTLGETCPDCDGKLRVIAYIEEPALIARKIGG